jgi:hypothetical protein
VTTNFVREDRTWGYGGAGPRYLAQDILADHLGFVPPRTVAMAYRQLGPAHWDQSRPWRTSSQELDLLLADPKLQAELEREREIQEREQQESWADDSIYYSCEARQ